jgi:hypothetical protein
MTNRPPSAGIRQNPLLPREHGPADAHDEKDRRIGRIAEGLHAQLDTAIIR